MLDSLIYKNIEIQVRGSMITALGYTYSVQIGNVEHRPSVKPLKTWDEAKLEGFQYGMKLVDQVLDSVIPDSVMH